MTAFTDRPEDAANRAYYNGGQQFRRVRAVIEADVEWRDDDPTYCLGVASVDLIPDTTARVREVHSIGSEIIDPATDKPTDPVAGEGTDAERGTWRHDALRSRPSFANPVPLTADLLAEHGGTLPDGTVLRRRDDLRLTRGASCWTGSGWEAVYAYKDREDPWSVVHLPESSS